MGGDLSFFTPRNFVGCNTKYKIQSHPRKNKLRFVARPKLPMWLFPLPKVRPPPPRPIQRIHNSLASHWNWYKCLHPDLPFGGGKAGAKQFGSKSRSGQEIKYTQARTTHFVAQTLHPTPAASMMPSLPLLWCIHCQIQMQRRRRRATAAPSWPSSSNAMRMMLALMMPTDNERGVVLTTCCCCCYHRGKLHVIVARSILSSSDLRLYPVSLRASRKFRSVVLPPPVVFVLVVAAGRPMLWGHCLLHNSAT